MSHTHNKFLFSLIDIPLKLMLANGEVMDPIKMVFSEVVPFAPVNEDVPGTPPGGGTGIAIGLVAVKELVPGAGASRSTFLKVPRSISSSASGLRSGDGGYVGGGGYEAMFFDFD